LRIITELELRDLFREQPFDTYKIEAAVKMTPAAIEFLNERKIKIVNEEGQPTLGSQHRRLVDDSLDKVRYEKAGKPEEFTHIKGSQLVLKTHNRIIFRGKLDTFQAYLISFIIEIQKDGNKQLADELMQILAYLRKMNRADVMDETLEFIDFNGWSDSEVRERSHHPKQYYGIGHFVPDPSQGPVLAGLNMLRAKVRELEISALSAFMNQDSNISTRQDITISLNRLSSLIYIMMCQYLGGIYGQQETAK
jgi:ethanolamine utilization cobalamin adenosyltransferase